MEKSYTKVKLKTIILQTVQNLSRYFNARERKSKCEPQGGEGAGVIPLPSQVSRFAKMSSSLSILSARSTIEQKYDNIEGCE